MGYYIGQFYFDKKEFFLLAALILLGAAIFLGYSLPIFSAPRLFVLALLLLITKSIIPSARDTSILLTFLCAVFLTLFLPFFTVVLFLFISLAGLKFTRLI